MDIATVRSPSGRVSATPEETAAIVAAVEVLWPQVSGDEAQTQDQAELGASWRFSGRWWAKPVASRRVRPW